MPKKIKENTRPEVAKKSPEAAADIIPEAEKINIPKRIVEIASTDNTYKSKDVVAKVLFLFSEGMSIEQVAKRCGVANQTAISIRDRHKEDLEEVSRDKAVKAVSYEERIINKYLNLTEKKADQLAANPEALASTRATELTGVVKELHNKVLLDSGRATSISQSLDPRQYESTKVEITRIVKAINNGDDTLLLEQLRATRE
jgi:transposase